MPNTEDKSDKAKRLKWSGFVESTVVNFFDEHDLTKMSIEDEEGNKAKISRVKEGGVKVEYSSTVIL